jgi:hypothetical protein
MKSFFQMLKLMDEGRSMGPTREHVRAHLRTVPHVVGKYLPDTKEWRIHPRHLKGDEQENAAYYTNDHQDAMDTATMLHRHVSAALGHTVGNKAMEVEG